MNKLLIQKKGIAFGFCVVYTPSIKTKEDRAMKTAKELINEILDLSEIALKKGNREVYRECMEMVADIIYRANVEEVA